MSRPTTFGKGVSAKLRFMQAWISFVFMRGPCLLSPRSHAQPLLGQRLREAPRPALLAGGLGDLVLAKLDLEIRQIPPQRVIGRAEIDIWIERVRLVVAHIRVARAAQGGEHRLGPAAVAMAPQRDLPWGRDPRHG